MDLSSPGQLRRAVRREGQIKSVFRQLKNDLGRVGQKNGAGHEVEAS
jgi:hypothetical protein